MGDSLKDQKERLEEFKKWSGLTWRELSERVGFPSTQNFTDMRNGRYRMKPRVADMITAAFPDIRREWILLGSGPMLASDQSSESGGAVPFYAGYSECGRMNPGTLFGHVDAALKVLDSAMTEFPKGCVAFLRKMGVESSPTPGLTYAVRGGGMFVVRNIRPSSDGVNLYPSCLDTLPDGSLLFAPISIPRSEDTEYYEVVGYASTQDGMYGITY